MKSLLKQFARRLLGEDPGTQAEVGSMVNSLIAELEEKVSPSAAAAEDARSTTDLVQPLPEPFSHRELEILRLIVNDRSVKEIAVALTISVNTAKVHIKSIYRKTGTHTRSALLQRVNELGVLRSQ